MRDAVRMNPLHAVPPIGPYYHGTRAANAKLILRNGFRRTPMRSYTGTGICLTESISIAYEYGCYEARGCVLEVWLSAATRWREDAPGMNFESTACGDAYDAMFHGSGLDAVRTFGGNVWVLWNPQVVVHVHRVHHHAALRRLCAQFDDDGPQCGYNHVVSDYASVWWGQAERDVNLLRFPEDRLRIERSLRRAVGRVQSSLIDHAAPP
jgi:hypothetical protein